MTYKAITFDLNMFMSEWVIIDYRDLFKAIRATKILTIKLSFKLNKKPLKKGVDVVIY